MLGIISPIRLTKLCLKCIGYIGLTLAICAYGSVNEINLTKIIKDLLMALGDILTTKLIIKLLVFIMNCVILLSEFSLNFVLFAFSIIYYVLVYVGEIFQKCQNMYCYLFSLSVFFLEIFSQLIMGRGNAINYALSWIVCLCLCCLYLDYKFCRVLNANVTIDELQEGDINQRHNNRNENEHIKTLERNPCPEDVQPHSTISEDNESDKDKMRHVWKQNAQDCWSSSFKEEIDSYLTLHIKMISRLRSQMKGERVAEFRGDDCKDSDLEPSMSTSEQKEQFSESNVCERCQAQHRHGEGDNEGNSLQKLCTVCMAQDRSVATFPCGHTHLCLTCVTAIMADTKICPICSNNIHYYKIIFL